MKPVLRSSLPLVALAMTAPPLHAAVTFLNGHTGTPAEVFSTTQFTYQGDVSDSDLLNGSIPATTGWNTTNNASPTELTDGIHGAGFQVVPGDAVQGAWTTTGATATYTLGPGANGLGYDVTSIQSIADWVNVGFGNQSWTLAVQLAGGGGFVNVATVNYQPLVNAVATNNIGTTKVTLTDLDITGIQALRVTANSANGGANAGAFLWRELDAFGSSTVPEPSAALLFGLGSLAFLRRRRA
jgi:hypothetical protein